MRSRKKPRRKELAPSFFSWFDLRFLLPSIFFSFLVSLSLSSSSSPSSPLTLRLVVGRDRRGNGDDVLELAVGEQLADARDGKGCSGARAEAELHAGLDVVDGLPRGLLLELVLGELDGGHDDGAARCGGAGERGPSRGRSRGESVGAERRRLEQGRSASDGVERHSGKMEWPSGSSGEGDESSSARGDKRRSGKEKNAEREREFSICGLAFFSDRGGRRRRTTTGNFRRRSTSRLHWQTLLTLLLFFITLRRFSPSLSPPKASKWLRPALPSGSTRATSSPRSRRPPGPPRGRG